MELSIVNFRLAGLVPVAVLENDLVCGGGMLAGYSDGLDDPDVDAVGAFPAKRTK